MHCLNLQRRFDKNNHLNIKIKNISSINFLDLKFCFSSIYSITSIKNAKISKKIGRYYEVIRAKKINFDSNKEWKFIIFLKKNNRYNFNKSSGLEGIFCLDKNNKKISIKISDLKFDNIVKKNLYKQKKYNKLDIPIIPEPFYYGLKKNYVDCSKGFLVKNVKIKNSLKTIKKIISDHIIFKKNKLGIKLDFKKIDCDAEGYKIEVLPKKITISSSSDSGIFYAIISLIQILSLSNRKIKQGTVIDYPRFKWRGMHLDCARQFYSVEKIMELLKLMSMFKMNRFHWHLTDNEAWRLDLSSYPNLTKKLAFRGYNKKIPGTYGAGFGPTGGFYSKKDIIKIIKFAKNLSIEVMPEIDIPSHCWSLINNFKELQEDKDKSWEKYKGIYPNNTLNPGLKETWNFLEKIFLEVSNIFPFNFIHVGFDEIPINSWTQSPSVKKLMKKYKLVNRDQVQEYFLKKIEKILFKFNKKTAAWNEAVTSIKSKNPTNSKTLIFAWENIQKGIIAAKKGSEVILGPAQICYFDMAYTDSVNERGLLWAGTIETKDIFNWDPVSKKTYKIKEKIKGIQGHLWSETITNINFMDIMINPRLIALSEVAWSKANRRKWLNFRSVLLKIVRITKSMGWKNHKF